MTEESERKINARKCSTEEKTETDWREEKNRLGGVEQGERTHTHSWTYLFTFLGLGCINKIVLSSKELVKEFYTYRGCIFCKVYLYLHIWRNGWMDCTCVCVSSLQYKSRSIWTNFGSLSCPRTLCYSNLRSRALNHRSNGWWTAHSTFWATAVPHKTQKSSKFYILHSEFVK